MRRTKPYRVKEIFYSLQGEGAHSGRPSVFLRFSKCNLWNGRESDRASSPCNFCDTDFVGTDGQNGGVFDDAGTLADAVRGLWPGGGAPWVVCTGGEPLLQLDEPLITALHERGFGVAIETNGTLPVPPGVDWVCLSPKGTAEVVLERCDELKLVYPQPDCPPERFDHIEARVRYLSPLASPAVREGDDPIREAHTRAALAYCLAHPQWRLSLQTHKLLGID
ncbi:7-carboxy-7-deazaguanine synthase [Hahella sp. SMD15-11]|uniref:7-carboxy-7-deazaguanine synthase n=1 Tax=Thermohahella caldifontis TaxID=3142973 RepID=A0AB39UUR8_9GAMM